MCKTLYNVVQYMNKTFMQSFSILLLCKKTVQYFVEISAILAMLATPKILLHSFVCIAQFCEQYWNVLVCRC